MHRPAGRRARRPLLELATVTLVFATAAGAQHGHQQPGELRHHTAHHRFEDAERWSKRFDDPARDAWQRPQEVVALMELEPGMTVADIGAGTGYFLGHLAAAVGANGTVLGLDIEPSMVDFMRERAEREGWSTVAARLVEPDDPGLTAGSVDRILVVNTWHHIADRGDYSAKLREALAPGGAVVVVDFTLESAHGPPKTQRLEAQEVVAELESGGLTASVATETLPEQYVVVGRKR
jgi:cyclopropane fatty-acyl-phospholipid synthase-like methyltransferase